MKCPKCEGEMELGIIADRSGSYDKEAAQWAKGKYLGWFLKDAQNIKSYRCKKCGYLESYAK